MRRSFKVPKSYQTRAVVLRTYKLGEADRIIVLLTENQGQKKAVAKGVRRSSSKFGSRLEPFMEVQIQLIIGKELDIVTSVETLHPFGFEIVKDYHKYIVANVIVEVVQKLSELSQVGDVSYYKLLCGAFNALCKGAYEDSLVLLAFLIRVMDISGWAASFQDCVLCQTLGPHRRFTPSLGGAVCDNCVAFDAIILRLGTFVLLEALRKGEWQKTVGVEQNIVKDANRIIFLYVQLHLDNGIRSLQQMKY